MKFGEKIKARRKELGMSVDELAKKIGKHRATIYRYENLDIESFPSDIINPVIRALDMDPLSFMGWENLSEAEDINLDQEALEFLKENPDVMVGFTTLKDADLLPEQKAAVIAGMIAHIKAFQENND